MIRHLTKEEVLENIAFFYGINYVKMTAEECIGRCLTSEYSVLGAFKEGKIVGIASYYRIPANRELAVIVSTNIVNNLREFRDKVYSFLKQEGVKIIQVESTRDIKAYEKVMDMKAIYTVFERRL